MKYRILERDGKFAIQKSKWGFRWKTIATRSEKAVSGPLIIETWPNIESAKSWIDLDIIESQKPKEIWTFVENYPEHFTSEPGGP